MKQWFRKLKQNFLRFIGNYFIYILATVLCKSLKIEIKNSEVIEELDRQNKKYVLAFWHGTMLLPWFMHRKLLMNALISKSKDGDLLSRLLKYWDYQVIRGSSSKGGNTALNTLIDLARNNNSIAVTPDGPRGPAHQFKAGAVITAKKSGLPLVLLGIGFKKKKILGSWDSFQIPRLFSEVKAVYSEPIYIDKDLNHEKTSEVIELCGKRLDELQLEAERLN
jgi:hypothetical protein